MAVAMLIGLWIWDELSFNKGIKNYKTTAQVNQNQTFNGEVQTWGSQARQLGPNHYTITGVAKNMIIEGVLYTGERIAAYCSARCLLFYA
jgi:hypothetical protein